jgi:uracil-DNA glycosylase family 4
MLYKEGFANQPISESIDDGLKLRDCFITAAVKCTPPLHKPTPQEFKNCNPYLQNELHLLKNVKAVLALGKFAFDSFLFTAREMGHSTKGIHFHFGAKVEIDDLPTLYGCYHPTPRNTNTGKLTEAMFCKLLRQIQKEV